MRAMGGAPKFTESQSLPDVDYAAFAASLGLQDITVDDADALAGAWDRALSADRPTSSTSTPTRTCRRYRPTRRGQFKEATAAVLGGDENAWGFLETGIKTKAQEFHPHRND